MGSTRATPAEITSRNLLAEKTEKSFETLEEREFGFRSLDFGVKFTTTRNEQIDHLRLSETANAVFGYKKTRYRLSNARQKDSRTISSPEGSGASGPINKTLR